MIESLELFAQGVADEHSRGKLTAFFSAVVVRLPAGTAQRAGPRRHLSPFCSTAMRVACVPCMRCVTIYRRYAFCWTRGFGDIITFNAQQHGAPSKYGAAWSPV